MEGKHRADLESVPHKFTMANVPLFWEAFDLMVGKAQWFFLQYLVDKELLKLSLIPLGVNRRGTGGRGG